MLTNEEKLVKFMNKVGDAIDGVFNEKRHCIIILQEGETGSRIGSTLLTEKDVLRVLESVVKQLKEGEESGAGKTTH